MRWILVFALTLSWMSAAWGQIFADHVPGTAVEYISWKGTGGVADQFAQSHLKEFLDSSQVQQFLEQNWRRPLQSIVTPDAKSRDIADKGMDFLAILLQHPSAFCFCLKPNSLDLQAVGCICDAGADAESLSILVRNMADSSGDKELRSSTEGSLVTISFAGDLTTVDPQNTLATDPDFQAALAQTMKSPDVMFYLHVTDAMAKQTPGLKKLVWAGGFQGKNWQNDILMQRTGTPAVSPAGSLEDIVRMIPDSTPIAGASILDASDLVADVKAAVTANSPGMGDALQKLLDSSGMDLQRDVLSAMGAGWGYCQESPQPGAFGPGFMRMILLNHPGNSEQAGAGFARLLTMIPASPQVTMISQVSNGNLYIGTGPKFVEAAANRPAGGKSILDNPKFLEVLKNLNAPDKIDGFSFYDLPVTAQADYPMVVFWGQQALGATGVLGQQTLASILPSPEKLTASLEPCGSIHWMDASGFHLRQIAPFPAAEIICAPEGFALDMGLQAVRVVHDLRPMFDDSVQQQKQRTCMQNMRKIDMTLMAYARANDKTFPPDLGTLVKTQDIVLDMFLCPGTGNTLPPDSQTWSPDQEADWVNNHCDYQYLAAGLKTTRLNPGIILVADKGGNHGTSMNLLFADGHVEEVDADRARQLLAASAALQKK